MAKKIIKLGTYRTLVSQLDKLARHNRQGSWLNNHPRHAARAPGG